MNLWVTEEDENIRVGYSVTNVLFSGQSEFQKIDVVDTREYGRMLLIDGLVMITDKDEFVYHEMIAHVPALLHKAPKRVVVIGGGDGGTVRELLKHDCIEEITLCEIDEMVVNASKEFFPKVSSGLNNSKVEVRIADGVAYAKDLDPQSVDLFIVDSTDPISVGEGLFSSDFYKSVARSLKPDGIMACQSECPWFDKKLHHRIQKNVHSGFENVKTYIGSVPTYPRGFWSWTLGAHMEIREKDFDQSRMSKVASGLRYLTPELLPASFVLPKFFSDNLKL